MSKQHNKKSGIDDFHQKVVNSWLKKDWKIIAGIVYLTINIFDFILFPIMFAVLIPALNPGVAPIEWRPLTTSNGGLFHMAFGAILGVTAWKEQGFNQAYANAAQAGAIESTRQDYYQPQQETPESSHPYASKYDPSIFAGPDNNTDWQGNQTQ
jgi:hypothetical protein